MSGIGHYQNAAMHYLHVQQKTLSEFCHQTKQTNSYGIGLRFSEICVILL